jgi:hypothetical protein
MACGNYTWSKKLYKDGKSAAKILKTIQYLNCSSWIRFNDQRVTGLRIVNKILIFYDSSKYDLDLVATLSGGSLLYPTLYGIRVETLKGNDLVRKCAREFGTIGNGKRCDDISWMFIIFKRKICRYK